MESNIASYHNYHVTQTGEVYRIGKDKPLYQGLAGRDNKIKYRIVTLVNKDGPRKFKVHRLVALAYIIYLIRIINLVYVTRITTH